MLKVLNEEGIIHLWTARSKINEKNDENPAKKAKAK
jgi:hypothetical protein